MEYIKGTWYKIIDKTDNSIWQAKFLKVEDEYGVSRFWTDVCIDKHLIFDSQEGWFDEKECIILLADMEKDVIPYLPEGHPDKIVIYKSNPDDLSETWKSIKKLLNL